MAKRKHTTKHRARTEPPKKTARDPTHDTRIAIDKHDYYQKGKFLVEHGLYAPHRKLNPRTLTTRQKSEITRAFHKFMDNGTMVGGHVIRPAQRTTRGWKVTPAYTFTDAKLPKSTGGIIATKTGAFIPKSMGHKVQVFSDGTIMTREKRSGHMRNVFAHEFNSAETITQLERMRKGEFKIPEGKEIRIQIFGNAINAPIIRSNVGLQAWLAKYGSALRSYAKKHTDSGLMRIELLNK